MSQNKRLVKEYSRFVQDPPELITAKPNEANILEWHYIITGPPNTLYHNGQYHGIESIDPSHLTRCTHISS